MLSGVICQVDKMTQRGKVPRATSEIDERELEERPHERLRRMLDRAKLSNQSVAKSLGVVPETVSRWRSGGQAIDDPALKAVIALLATRGVQVTMGWMRYGEVPKAPRSAQPTPVDLVKPGTSSRDLQNKRDAK
jgi:DNA-binding transcriptional regulator YiaG